jgi:hypothetical protein
LLLMHNTSNTQAARLLLLLSAAGMPKQDGQQPLIVLDLYAIA